MALYTELFSEWLDNGGELPAAFADIDGFEDLFARHYCDSELGFETETLFKIKIDEYASVYIPLYKEKLTALESVKASFGSGKTTESTADLGATKTTTDLGATHSKATELPFDTTATLPASTADADAVQNVTSGDAVQNKTTTNETLTPDERQRAIDYLERRAYSLKRELLDEFKPLFMEIF